MAAADVAAQILKAVVSGEAKTSPATQTKTSRHALQHSADVLDRSITDLKCHSASQGYDAAIAAADFSKAAMSVADMAKSLRQLPSLDNVIIFGLLQDRHEEMENALRSRLEYLISQAFAIDTSPHQMKIQVSKNISAPAIGEISLLAVLRAIHIQSASQSYFGPFARAVLKNVLIPLVKESRWEVLETDLNSGLSSITLKCRYDHESRSWVELGEGSLFGILTHIFDFIHASVCNEASTAPTDAADASEAAKHSFPRVLGDSCWPDLSNSVVTEYLSRTIPDDVKGLESFGEIKQHCTEFENRLIEIGVITSEHRTLTNYCNNIDLHFSNKKEEKLIEMTREIILDGDYSTVALDEFGPPAVLLCKKVDIRGAGAGDMHADDAQDSLFVFPACTVSTKAVRLIQLAEETLGEAATANPHCALRLYYTVRSLFDLFRAVMPVHHSAIFESVPQLAAVFHNDCMYIAHRVLSLGSEWRGKVHLGEGQREMTFIDMAGEWRRLGEKVLNLQLAKQRDNLRECIESADGFDVVDDARHAAVERAIKQVLYQLRHLSKLWKPVLPPHLYCRCMGILLDHGLLDVIHQTEKLIDIGAEESHKLHNLLLTLQSVTDLFPPPPSSSSHHTPRSLTEHYVPHFNKFVQLTDLLDLSFADIMARFRAGVRYEFEGAELQRLIRALFADTPLRVKNLEEIGRGRKV
ncbi:Centromere/kinetochore protein zw10 [Borealophlyctis nickersoniae]|nr:Centromere/kinetochore protein zw10 [Borealophlyctis nickersoniae]